jgi:hypothetical protein
MTTRLTDNERTLLSAHRDGELAGADAARAERLLESSAEAREYVRDLRSLTEFSQAAFPAAPAIGVGAGIGIAGKLTSGAIQTAARTTAKSGAGLTWGLVGLAAAAVTTVAILTSTLGGGETPATPVSTQIADRNRPVDIHPASLDMSSSAVMVPAITSEELIDFAVSGRLPIDSSRRCYVSVAPQKGALAINVHGAAGTVPPRLSGLDLRAVPGIDSIERAIRTSLLQSEGNGLAVSYDLPSLRLRVLEELQEVADELPEEIRRTMDGTRADLEREYQRLSSELRHSQLDTRRGSDAPVRYAVIAGTDLPKAATFGSPIGAFTITTNDKRCRTFEVTSSELGTLGVFAGTPRVTVLERPTRARVPSAAPARVFVRRPSTAARAASAPAVAVAPTAQDSTITFEQIQIMRQRGETLDGIFVNSEAFIERATRILQRADSIRRHIEVIRRQQLENVKDDEEIQDAPAIDEGDTEE